MRLRFAPAPTGSLHVGGARTALFNWLLARKSGGEFLLRFEDTDIERSHAAAVEDIKESLLYLGLNWDKEPIFQSQRLNIYEEYANKLQKEGKAYFCFCTPEEIEEERKEKERQNIPYKYSGKCLRLTEEERRILQRNRVPSLRFRVPEEKMKIQINDLIRGDIYFDSTTIGDFIILRSDKRPTYNFACVIDDYLLGITHILRGEDHISNTPRQILIYQALGIENLPKFGHLPLILDKSRAPLSKRSGALSILEYRKLGYLPSAIINYIALLGFATEDSQQLFFTTEELLDKFSLDRVSKSSAIFDEAKLDWINREHIRYLKMDELSQKISEFLEKPPLVPLDKLISLYKYRLTHIAGLENSFPYLFDEEVVYSAEAKTVLKGENTKYILERVYQLIYSLEDYTEEKLEDTIRNLAKALEIKAKDIIHPLRAVVTGTTVGPPLFQLLSILPKKIVLNRIKNFIK